MSRIILLILIVILILLIYLIFQSQWKHICPISNYDHIAEILEKMNNFVQDICTHIGEESHYIVLLGDKCIKGNRIYICATDITETDLYNSIIILLANDFAKKYNNKDVDTVIKRLEQISYNLGYLSTKI